MSNTRKLNRPRRSGISPHSGEGRELGLDDRVIPGGLTHVANPETHPSKVQKPAQRHVKMDVEHGVPDPNPNQPYDQPRAGKVIRPKPQPEPKPDIAVPVYIVEKGDDCKYIRTFVSGGPMTLVAGDQQRIADRDLRRIRLYISNEAVASADLLRVGTSSDVDQGNGLALFGGTLEHFVTQDEVWVLNPTGAAIEFSWGYETEIPAVGV